MNKDIRLAKISDSKAIVDIYKPFIENTTITFEYEVPTVEEFESRMEEIQRIYPWFVAEIDKKIVGYAYASKYNKRAAYDWAVDFAIYIDPKYHRKGIGKGLYHALLNTLKLQGFNNAYALVTSPNFKSEQIHKALGFTEMGKAKNVGYKMGKWLDVTTFELQFGEHVDNPAKPKCIYEVINTEEYKKILREARENISIEK